jgi:hypothetical protein
METEKHTLWDRVARVHLEVREVFENSGISVSVEGVFGIFVKSRGVLIEMLNCQLDICSCLHRFKSLMKRCHCIFHETHLGH